MIIDFSVENYRSIRDKALLSFIAQNASADNAICSGYSFPGRNFKLLPVAAIYGANASGKSNVLRALDEVLRSMIRSRENTRTVRRAFTPFRLEKDTQQSPTNFELRVIIDNEIFEFRLSLLNGFIWHEQLDYSPTPSKRQSKRFLYSRVWDNEKEEYVTKFGEHFSGPHTQLLAKAEKYNTYISLLQQLDVELLKKLSRWLSLRVPGMFCGSEKIDLMFAANIANAFSDNRAAALKIIRAFDLGLDDIPIELIEQDNDDKPDYRLWAVHNTPGGPVRWEFEEESLGTQRLFTLIQPLLVALAAGTPLIADEFGSNFHPKISREIIKVFHEEATNPDGAQLILTSHDNTLWRGHLLRRDEIWLTEKGLNGATVLFSLSDYRVRNDLSLDKAYLDGRFGAVPVIDDIENLLEPVGANKSDEEQS